MPAAGTFDNSACPFVACYADNGACFALGASDYRVEAGRMAAGGYDACSCHSGEEAAFVVDSSGSCFCCTGSFGCSGCLGSCGVLDCGGCDGHCSLVFC